MLGDQDELEIVNKHLEKTLSDPLVKSLMPNSLFTKIQLEALLIDYLLAGSTIISITPEKKANIRKVSRGRTRGSYNRTLAQSKMKLTRLISSLILMGYLGILNTNSIVTLAEMVSNLHKLQQEAINDVESEGKTVSSGLRQKTALSLALELEKYPKLTTEQKKAKYI